MVFKKICCFPINVNCWTVKVTYRWILFKIFLRFLSFKSSLFRQWLIQQQIHRLVQEQSSWQQNNSSHKFCKQLANNLALHCDTSNKLTWLIKWQNWGDLLRIKKKKNPLINQQEAVSWCQCCHLSCYS